jgi:transposase
MLKQTGTPKEVLAELTEKDVRQLLSPMKPRTTAYVEPDLECIAKELKRPGVTRKLLWYEYGNTATDDKVRLYSYQQFCKIVDRHLAGTHATMHLTHEPAQTMFVDWSGDTLVVKDRVTGTQSKVYLFVACLPYSGYFYVKGFLDVKQHSWLEGHMAAFESFGGVPSIVVPDNC